MVQTYSLSLEHQFQGNWLVSIAGAGDIARHLPETWNLNQPLPDAPYNFNPIINTGSVFTYLYGQYQGYGAINTTTFGANAYWDALEISMRHPVGHDLMLSASYTWQHDLSQGRGASIFGTSTPQNAYEASNDYGNSNLNVGQVFTVNGIWSLPWFRTARGWKHGVLGGWQYSDITVIQSGFSLDPGLSTATKGIATRPNRTTQSISGPRTVQEWFNTAAFAAPAAGYFGNAGTGVINGPGTINFDMALYKDFHIAERASVQFRSELFNVFNHANFSIPCRRHSARRILAKYRPRAIRVLRNLLSASRFNCFGIRNRQIAPIGNPNDYRVPWYDALMRPIGACLLIAALAAAPVPKRVLPLASTLALQLEDESETLLVEVPAGCAARLTVHEERGIAGRFAVLKADGDAAGATFARLNTTWLVPSVEYLTLLAGRYQIVIEPAFHSPVKRLFSLETSAAAPATDADRRQHEAEALDGRGRPGLRVSSSPDSLVKALQKFQAALAIQEQAPKGPALANALHFIAFCQYTQGDMTAARATYQKALEIFTSEHDQLGMASILDQIGLIDNDTGKPKVAHFVEDRPERNGEACSCPGEASRAARTSPTRGCPEKPGK